MARRYNKWVSLNVVVNCWCALQLSTLRREKRNVPHGLLTVNQSSTSSSTESSNSGGGLSVLTAPVSDNVSGYSATVTFRQHRGSSRGRSEWNRHRLCMS